MISIDALIYFYSFFIVVCFILIAGKFLQYKDNEKFYINEIDFYKRKSNEVKLLHLQDLKLKAELQQRLNHINQELSKLTNTNIES